MALGGRLRQHRGRLLRLRPIGPAQLQKGGVEGPTLQR